jgi:hypothetical protein
VRRGALTLEGVRDYGEAFVASLSSTYQYRVSLYWQDMVSGGFWYTMLNNFKRQPPLAEEALF